MNRSIVRNDRHQGCVFFQQDQEGHRHCRLLEFSGYPCAIATPRGHIEWATASALKLLQRYWPAGTGVQNRLPRQIHQWMTTCRRGQRAKDKAPREVAPLSINGTSACLTIRHMRDGAFSALLFEEHLLESSADRLLHLGLTPRERDVLRWLAQGKSSSEIAIILNISVRTVSKHLERVYLRLGVENRHAAVAMVQEPLKRIALRH